MLFARLQRYTPAAFSPLHRVAVLHDEFEHLFRQAWHGLREASADGDADTLPAGTLPALDLFEDKDTLIAKLELPGAKKEDIAVSLEGGVLAVSGERKQDSQYDTATVCRCERVAGRFERRVTLPYPVDSKNIKAAYTDGVLTVTLPKAEEAKPKQITIDIK
jgi:HSP20 family protein